MVVILDKDSNPLLAAYYVAGWAISGKELASHLSESLPRYMIPSFFIQLDALPLTLNGKIDKKALPDPLQEGKNNTDAFKAPVTPAEIRIAGIWQRVFALEQVGIKDNFFGLGGHSLKATQIILEIFREFRVRVSLDTIFDKPTVEELAKVVSDLENSEHANIIPVEKKEYYDVSPAQDRIWSLNSQEKNQTACIISEAFQLDGELNPELLQEAFTALVGRHESLRTGFVLINDALKQQIHDPADVPFTLEYIDLRRSDNAAEIVKTEIGNERYTSFDLEHGPLLKARLFQVDDTRHILLLTMHNIISDGRSMEVLIKEASELYRSYSEKTKSNLPQLGIQQVQRLRSPGSSWTIERWETATTAEFAWLDYLAGDIKIHLQSPHGLSTRLLFRTFNGEDPEIIAG